MSLLMMPMPDPFWQAYVDAHKPPQDNVTQSEDEPTVPAFTPTTTPTPLQSSATSRLASQLCRDRYKETFLLFPHLPAELRIKIWRFSFPHRVVTIQIDKATSAVVSPTILPSMFSANRESRQEALRFYDLVFATRSAPATIYFSSRIDSIYFPRRSPMGYDESLRDFKPNLLHPNELDDISEVALDYVDTSSKRPWEAYDKAVLIQGFPGLKNVELVLGTDEYYEIHNLDGKIETVDAVLVLGEARVQAVLTEFRCAWAHEEELAKTTAQGGDNLPVSGWTLPEVRVAVKKLRLRFSRSIGSSLRMNCC